MSKICFELNLLYSHLMINARYLELIIFSNRIVKF